tara:strand:+ start:759 stop:1001 length:243 start_codon:yes stop_codon:yes gene_type:complete
MGNVRRCKKCGVYETSEYLSPNGYCEDHESERAWKNGKNEMVKQNLRTRRMANFVNKRKKLDHELDKIKRKGSGKVFSLR